MFKNSKTFMGEPLEKKKEDNPLDIGLPSDYQCYGLIKFQNEKLNDLLGGGVKTGTITEVYGESKTGKTEMAYQLIVNAQLPEEKGGLNSDAIYVSNRDFNGDRVLALGKALDLDSNFLKRIHIGRVYYRDKQNIKQVGRIIKEYSIKLLVIDNLIGLLGNYSGIESLAPLAASLNSDMNTLKQLINRYNLAVFITNDDVEPYRTLIPTNLKYWNGEGRVIRRIYLEKNDKGERFAEYNNQKVKFSITPEGIRD